MNVCVVIKVSIYIIIGYIFLTVDVGAYLMDCDTCTIYFLKDLVRGKRKCEYSISWNDIVSYSVIKNEDIKVLYLPQYQSLTIESILAQGKKDAKVVQYLPEDRDMHKVPRQWLINVIYTIVGEPFHVWVKQCIQQRNDELAVKQDLLIDLDPEIAKAFESSVNISTSNGISAHLLKAGSKRRRTQAEMREQIEMEDLS